MPHDLGSVQQITRADSGFLALQNPSTNKLHLRGGGLHSKILTYDLPVSDATNLCPSSVLLHAAHTRKVRRRILKFDRSDS